MIQLGGRQERAHQRGVPLSLIEGFPCHEYKDDPMLVPPLRLPPPPQLTSEGLYSVPVGSDTVLPAVVDMSPIECSICLCEYTEGEMLRTLPCQHAFHQKCVDQWLQNHSTCCICRSSVLPHQLQLPSESSAPSTETAAQQQQLNLIAQAAHHQPLNVINHGGLPGVSGNNSAIQHLSVASEQGQVLEITSWRGPAVYEQGVGSADGSLQLPRNGTNAPEQQTGRQSWMQRYLPGRPAGSHTSDVGQGGRVDTANIV